MAEDTIPFNPLTNAPTIAQVFQKQSDRNRGKMAAVSKQLNQAFKNQYEVKNVIDLPIQEQIKVLYTRFIIPLIKAFKLDYIVAHRDESSIRFACRKDGSRYNYTFMILTFHKPEHVSIELIKIYSLYEDDDEHFTLGIDPRNNIDIYQHAIHEPESEEDDNDDQDIDGFLEENVANGNENANADEPYEEYDHHKELKEMNIKWKFTREEMIAMLETNMDMIVAKTLAILTESHFKFPFDLSFDIGHFTSSWRKSSLISGLIQLGKSRKTVIHVPKFKVGGGARKYITLCLGKNVTPGHIR